MRVLSPPILHRPAESPAAQPGWKGCSTSWRDGHAAQGTRACAAWRLGDQTSLPLVALAKPLFLLHPQCSDLEDENAFLQIYRPCSSGPGNMQGLGAYYTVH